MMTSGFKFTTQGYIFASMPMTLAIWHRHLIFQRRMTSFKEYNSGPLCITGMISPDYQGEVKLLLHNGSAAAAAKSLQSCLTLCDPRDGSPPGCPTRIPHPWDSWKWKVKVKSLSCVQLLATPWTAAYQAPPSMGFSRQEYWSGLPLPSPSQWFSSVQFSCSVVFTSLEPNGLQHTRPPCPSPTPRVYPNPSPLSQWCHPTISSSVVPFPSCLKSFSTSGSFQMSQLFASGGQNIGVSASTSVLPMNTQGWFPLGWTGWISLQSKGLSRVFSNTTVQKHIVWNI